MQDTGVNYIRHQKEFYSHVRKDHRLKAHDISLYLALFQIWNDHHFRNRFPILREEAMLLSGIGSRNTYSICLKWLHECGYIIYQPSLRPYVPSLISIVPFREAQSKQLTLFETPKLKRKGIRNPLKVQQATPQMDPHANPESDPAKGPFSHAGPQMDPHANPELDPAKGPLSHADPQMDPHAMPETDPSKGPLNKLKNDTHTCLKNELRMWPKSKPGTDPKLRHNYNKQINNETESKMPPSKKNIYANEKKSPPTIEAVATWFAKRGHPAPEARKFFYHYQAINWTLSGQPIADWEAAAAKWSENIKNTNLIKPGKLHTDDNKIYTNPL